MKLKKGKFLGAILLSVFLLSSCKALKNPNTLFQSEYDKFADTLRTVYIANAGAADDNIYKIRPFDLISVRNIQNPLGPNPPAEGAIKPTVFRIDEKGDITLPVLGAITIAGLNQSEARAKIQDLYEKSLLKDPIIELIVVNFKVTLIGDVVKPGNYLVDREHTNLIEIMGESGGLTPTSDAGKIKIIRGDLKSPEIIYINLTNLASLSSEKLRLQNNDIIYIPRKRNVLVEGLSKYINAMQPILFLANMVLLYTLRR